MMKYKISVTEWEEKVRLVPYHEAGHLLFLLKIYKEKALGDKKRFLKYVSRSIKCLSASPNSIRGCIYYNASKVRLNKQEISILYLSGLATEMRLKWKGGLIHFLKEFIWLGCKSDILTAIKLGNSTYLSVRRDTIKLAKSIGQEDLKFIKKIVDKIKESQFTMANHLDFYGLTLQRANIYKIAKTWWEENEKSR